MQEQDLLLISSQDCTVSLWSLQGGLVGVMGKHTWTLLDPSTWQDAKGVRMPASVRENDEAGTWQADQDQDELSSSSDDQDFQACLQTTPCTALGVEWASPADQVLAMRRIKGDRHATIAAMHKAVASGYSALTLHEACTLPEGPVGRKVAAKSVTAGVKAVQAVAAQ
ncbi:hypothetical protein ABBQ32_004389 [Trebouxia sp. C0010 RCD-2024]